MEFYQLDVFADAPYTGNALAVFPDAAELNSQQMQTLASEMNLSETAFVTRIDRDSYDVRIFTPREELPFAGHPTLGTAWLLRHLGLIQEAELTQRSAAGDTQVRLEADLVWFTRSGESSDDLDHAQLEADVKIAAALGLGHHDVGMEARELGRSGRLRPAFSSAGIEQLIVPVRDLDALGSISVTPDALLSITPVGAYCFTAVGAGHLRARGFFPALGIAEDPATGSAAAGLGVYLTRRIGKIEARIDQGIEMKRPSAISLRADGSVVSVGGSCRSIFKGTLEVLP